MNSVAGSECLAGLQPLPADIERKAGQTERGILLKSAAPSLLFEQIRPGLWAVQAQVSKCK